MLVGSLNGNLMYHFLVVALLLPCADFSKQRSPPGMHMDAELVWCWSGRVGGGFRSSAAQSLRLLCATYDRKLLPLSWQTWVSSPQLLPDS